MNIFWEGKGPKFGSRIGLKKSVQCHMLYIYSETSLNQTALETKNMPGLEGWPVLLDFFCKELFDRDLKNLPIFREGQFKEVSL
jgi:hypothetical protein